MDKPAFLPFALPCIGEEEIASVVETIRSGWLTTGPKTKAFEEAFASTIGVKHALAVNSATAGLHLALEALGIGRDDLVLTPVWTFTASAEVSSYLGAHPVFVDIDPATFNFDIDRLERKIVELKKAKAPVKAIMPVHFAGQACEMQRIVELAKTHDLKILEDAAHSFPTTVQSATVNDGVIKDRQIGTIGDATAFSFYATKTIATGEGGMITTDNDDIARRVRTMRLHGISRDVWDRYSSTKPSWYYEVIAPGYKYNLTDIASSLGLCQLAKSMKFYDRRLDIAQKYNAAFVGNAALEIPQQAHKENIHSWHLYVLRLNLDRLNIDRDVFIQKMAERGIGCSVHFIPLHMQPCWRDGYNLTPAMFPVATHEFQRVVSLPIYPGMSDDSIQRVIDAVTDLTTAHKA